MPQSDEPFIGAHCVAIFGSSRKHDNGDGTTGALWCPNSWGKDFAAHGWFWMPWGYILELLAMDLNTIHQVM